MPARPPHPRAALLAAVLAALPCAGCLTVGGAAPVTPKRPLVARAPTTTAAGTFEIEVGAEVDPEESVRVPLTIKAGLEPRTEFFVSVEHVELHVPGENPEGLGEFIVGTRHRFLERGATFASFEIATKLPSPDSFGSGRLDFLAGASLMTTIERFTLLSTYRLGLLGSGDDRLVDVEHTLAIAGALPASASAAAFAEVAGISGESRDELLRGTLGVLVPLAPNFAFDVGLRADWTDAGTDLTLLVGLTTNLGPLFRSP